jgi:hypothetical protein
MRRHGTEPSSAACVAAHGRCLANEVERAEACFALGQVRRLSGGVAGRTAQMNMQSGQTGRGGGLFSNLWVQLALLVIAAIILVSLAAKFIW